MNENYENYTIADITTMGTAKKRDFSVLPKIKYFTVQSRGAVGTLKDLHERKVGAWTILVRVEGEKIDRLASDILFHEGMKYKCEYATKEEAYKVAMKFKAEWGKVVEKAKKEKKPAVKVANIKDAIIKELGEDYWNEIVAKAEAAKKAVAA